jgi:dTDP-4-amino-4,6-dideoxygalactose transaminase
MERPEPTTYSKLLLTGIRADEFEGKCFVHASTRIANWGCSFVTQRISSLIIKAKPLLRPIARATLGRLPAPASRLSGPLAYYGGQPVRDLRLRPWASVENGNAARWDSTMRRVFRLIFVRGIEGLPQPLAAQFAQQWAAYCGCRYGLLLTNGTDALRIALAAALDHDGLEYGGEIVVPNFSFIATATAPLDRRFGVALVDVDPETLLLDAKRVEEAIIPGKTRAILPVHLFGQPADMTALRIIGNKYGLKIIEDAAQAHGAIWEGAPVGSLGDVGCFSFQSSKNLACGEGGALTTNDEQTFERAYLIHNYGRSRIAGERWEHLALGGNNRLTEYQAALLIHRFKEFPKMQMTRRKNFEYLRGLMNDVACLVPLALSASVHAHGMYMFAMRYRRENCGGFPIEEFLSLVQAEGAPIHRAFSATISDQPVMQKLSNKRPEYIRRLPTPVADRAAGEVVFIPQHVFLGTPGDMVEIVAAAKKVEVYCSRAIARPPGSSGMKVHLGGVQL